MSPPLHAAVTGLTAVNVWAVVNNENQLASTGAAAPGPLARSAAPLARSAPAARRALLLPRGSEVRCDALSELMPRLWRNDAELFLRRGMHRGQRA